MMKKDELVKKVILAAGKGLIVGSVLAFPPLAMSFQTIFEVIEEIERKKPSERKIRRVLYNLEKRKLVSLKEVNGELWVNFKRKGKELLLKYKLDELKIERPSKWDKKWRLVIFDIPEKKKSGREALRKKLKQLEFFQLQRSVFIHPFECQEEIELLAKVYEIEPYVYFLRVNYIDNQRRIKEQFSFL